MTKYYITEDGVRDITDLLNKTDETMGLLLETVQLLKNQLEVSGDNQGIKKNLEEELQTLRSSIDAINRKFVGIERLEIAVKAGADEKMERIRKALVLISQGIEKAGAGSAMDIEGLLKENTEKQMHGIAATIKEIGNVNENLKSIAMAVGKNSAELEKIKAGTQVGPQLLNPGIRKISSQASGLKRELKKMNELLLLLLNINKMTEKLWTSYDSVSSIKTTKTPAWLKRQNDRVAKAVAETTDMLGELAIARMLASGDMSDSDAAKKSPLSPDKTKKILKKLIKDKRIIKKKKGKLVFYSLK
ncbi:MAG: hypothetical protein HZB66_02165 [Candidatus Aenigmarchaeota archaeon]|nr:hypothetical protein [Candidatus Aenigmarchaeota archaeon]